MRTVVALVDDLLFQSKLAATARQVGVTLKMVTSPQALAEAIAAGDASLLIVDLNARSNPIEAVEQLRAAGCALPILAFLSHVQVELAERAHAAGCDEVMPRSKFTQNLAAILTGTDPHPQARGVTQS